MNRLTTLYRRYKSKMTAAQAANLNVLQNFMDSPVPQGRLNMDVWQGDHFNENDCGTRACALGWACTIPHFKAQGLAIRDYYNPFHGRMAGPTIPNAGGSYESCQMLFGLSFDAYIRLFGRNGGDSGRVWDDPKYVAAAIREVMIESGYEPTAVTAPEFKKFMERATALA